MRATVIGGGVVGLATATELSERGAEVTLYERNAELGGNASWLAGGMLARYCEGESAPESVVARGAGAIDWRKPSILLSQYPLSMSWICGCCRRSPSVRP